MQYDSNGNGWTDYDRFISARSDDDLTDRQFAETVGHLDTFTNRHERAAIQACRAVGRDACIDDARQTAFITLLDYLNKTRGRDFHGDSLDQLGAWLFAMCRMHASWAAANLDRSQRRRSHHELRAANLFGELYEEQVEDDRLQRLMGAVIELPSRERRIVAGILKSESIEEIVDQLAISRRTYFRHYARALKMLRRTLGSD